MTTRRFLSVGILVALVVAVRAALRGDPGRRAVAAWALAHLGPVAVLAPFTAKRRQVARSERPSAAASISSAPSVATSTCPSGIS